MRCKTCHYSLANLTEHRCPECGTPFDPNDPSTFDPGFPHRRLDIARVLCWLVFAVIVAFIGLQIYIRIWEALRSVP